MYPREIKNYNAFLDGRSYMGLITICKLPDLKIKTEAHRGGGMDSELHQDMGFEIGPAEATFAEYDPRLVRLLGSRRKLVARPGAQGEDGTVDTLVFTLSGRWTGLDGLTLEAGKRAALKLTCQPDYYRYQHNFRTEIEIDVENAVRMIGGVDQMAALRKAMGVGA
jgi:hypothetical protein